MIETVGLRDGTPAWVFPLQVTSKQRLAAEYENLSPESQRRRFLAPITHLSDAMLHHLVDDVDWIDHVAFVLYVDGADEMVPIAIGRMVRYPTIADAADLAVTVKDGWQGRGAATALLPVLLEHRPQGVTHVITEVSADNPASLKMLARLGELTVNDSSAGILDVVVDLSGAGEPRSDVDPDADRLHPALLNAWRATFRTRDRVCPWLR